MMNGRQELASRRAKEQGPGRLAWLRPIHVAGPLAAIAALFLLVKLWPAPAAEQTLAKFLESRDEDNIQPDASLATRDFRLAIRSFKDIELLSATTYDYASELRAAQKPEGKVAWGDLLSQLEPSSEKRRAFELLRPALPAELTPNGLADLRITVQPATAHLVFKQRGTALYQEGRFRFMLIRATSPTWQCGWKVADMQRDQPPSPSPSAPGTKKEP